MALFPLTSNFQEDFVLQLLAVDTENSMDELAAAAAVHSVGRRVKPRPGVLRVRRQGTDEAFPRNLKVGDAGLRPMECVEIYWEGSAGSVRAPRH
ncbi:toluene-4-monooxygenase system B family protein [uncultured Nevskia sp.]|uniref:toluene-4-monooxygenase system B family protein n=1 Tax=uncultured Nevskia sp. TaxID=228950 RepID=UPI0025EFBB2E|nr:toluene-4-monooxygenase system B family protein [uncultured Nevskia sp.]